jgi:hypothetical protein
MSSSENAMYPNVGNRNRGVLRGLIIATLSTFITAFVLFIFSPLFPINIFEGGLGYISFVGIIILSYVFYLALPSESGSSNELPDSKNIEK